MAVPFPSYLDSLVKGFPEGYNLVKGFSEGFETSSVPHPKYVEDSQIIGESIEKLFSRLSVLLFHIDNQINKVLLQGRYLPKKLTRWATEARVLKSRVSDLLKEQQMSKGYSLKYEQLVDMGIKMINHLKKCPSKDELMYDKPTPVVVLTRKLGLNEPVKELVHKYRTEEGVSSYVAKQKIEESLDPLQGQDVPPDLGAAMIHFSPSLSVTSEELKESNDAGSRPISTSESRWGGEILEGTSSYVHDSMISATATSDSNSASISKPLSNQQSTTEITEEGMTRETNMPSAIEQETRLHILGLSEHMAISVSDFDSHEEVESAFSEEHMLEIDVIKQETLQPSSSRERQCCYNVSVLEDEHYAVTVKDNLIKLELDNQTILIGDYPSSGPVEISPVNGVINLVEQDLHELPEKPDYPDPLLLFLQRNNRLTHIHSSFFDSMPDLRLLDLSDTKIRMLPISLFRLSKLKVLMLRNCVCLDELPAEIGELKHLEVLDISGTELYNIPDEIGQLTFLSHMQLSFYGPDDESEYVHLPSELMSHDIISKLKALEALSIVVHPEDHRWTRVAKYIVNDAGRLEKLSYLQIYFPEVEDFEHFIQISLQNEQRLRNFRFVVGHNVKRIVSRVPDEEESKYNQQGRCLRFVNGEKVPQGIETVLKHVTAFYLDHHVQIQSLSEFGISNFNALKFCVVTECPNIQVMMNEVRSECAFPCLEHLGVYYLWELEQIWKTPVPSGSFHALKYLIVNTCPKLKFILCESMLQCLSNLAEFVVEDCVSVEKIVEEEKDTIKYDVAIVLPRLRKLVLKYLPRLVSLGNGLCLSQENIINYGCPNLDLSYQLNKQTRRKERKFCGCRMCI